MYSRRGKSTINSYLCFAEDENKKVQSKVSIEHLMPKKEMVAIDSRTSVEKLADKLLYKREEAFLKN